MYASATIAMTTTSATTSTHTAATTVHIRLLLLIIIDTSNDINSSIYPLKMTSFFLKSQLAALNLLLQLSAPLNG